MTDPDAVKLSIGTYVLGGPRELPPGQHHGPPGAAGRARVSSYQDFAQLGFVEVFADVKPGVDPDKVAARLDEIINGFIEEGPTEDEVQRVVIRKISDAIDGLDSVGGFGGQAPTLAEGLLYADDPAFYKKRLAYASPPPM